MVDNWANTLVHFISAALVFTLADGVANWAIGIGCSRLIASGNGCISTPGVGMAWRVLIGKSNGGCKGVSKWIVFILGNPLVALLPLIMVAG